MVSEWNVIEDGAVIVAVECPPSSIAILHTDHPRGSPLNGFRDPILIGKSNPFERHQHECRVIDVGIEVIAELERPTPGSRVSILDLPVAGPCNLFVQ